MTWEPARIVRAALAGLRGALVWIALLVVALIVGIIGMQAAILSYETGTLMILPSVVVGASSTPYVNVTGATPAQAAAIRRAVASMKYRPPHTALTFAIAASPCPDCGAEYVPWSGLIRIDPQVAANDFELRRVVAHEIGHWVDQTYLTDAQRAEYRRLRYIPENLTWFAPDAKWEARPSEDFAEVFAMLNITSASGLPGTYYGPITNRRELIAFLDSAGVHLADVASTPDLRSVVLQELAFTQYLLSPWWTRLALALVFVYYAWVGASEAVPQEWRRN